MLHKAEQEKNALLVREQKLQGKANDYEKQLRDKDRQLQTSKFAIQQHERKNLNLESTCQQLRDQTMILTKEMDEAKRKVDEQQAELNAWKRHLQERLNTNCYKKLHTYTSYSPEVARRAPEEIGERVQCGEIGSGWLSFWLSFFVAELFVAEFDGQRPRTLRGSPGLAHSTSSRTVAHV